MGEQAVLQDLLGAELVAAVNHGDGLGEVGQEQGFLDGGVAAADHHHLLAAVEEAVAGGAGRDAEALIGGLRLQSQPFGLGAGGNDDRLGQDFRARIERQAEGALGQVGLSHDVMQDFGADMFSLGLHLLHQPGALNGLGEAGIVLDVCGDGQLAARLKPGDHHRVQRGAGGVDGGGPAGGAGTDDGDTDGTSLGVGLGHGPI